MFYYHTLKELEDLVNENKLEVWQVVEQSDMEENGRTKEQSYEKMLNMYLAMKEADKNYNGNLKETHNNNIIKINNNKETTFIPNYPNNK